MKLRWIDSEGVSNHDLAELPDLRKRTDGFLWLDLPEWSDDAEALLAREFHFHPIAISESKNRNHIPRVHVYPHHLFIVVHAPEIGAGGHVHYLELDQFVRENLLVTIHGPLNPKVPLESALRETDTVAARMDSGRLHPTSPFGLTYAIVSSIAHREADMVAEIAREVGLMEQRVMAEEDEDPQEVLRELFAARHELLTIKTMAEQCSEILSAGRSSCLALPHPRAWSCEGRARTVRDPRPHRRLTATVSDRCYRVLPCANYYKMTIAAERLAVIAAITLTITLISPVMGMNVIVNDSTRWISLTISQTGLVVISDTDQTDERPQWTGPSEHGRGGGGANGRSSDYGWGGH
jgi:magnesium transporter